jgi:hypothetical protein
MGGLDYHAFDLNSIEQPFLKQLQFHPQPPDLFEELHLRSLLLPLLSHRRATENRRPLFQELPLPLADLVRVQPMFGRWTTLASKARGFKHA